MQQYEKDHLALVLENAAECTVLLKSNGDFPLGAPQAIDAFGAGLRYTVKGGTDSESRPSLGWIAMMPFAPWSARRLPRQ